MKAAPEQLAVIRAVVRALGDLGNEAVFVGGMIRGLLLTDPGASAPRHTDDVDLVFEIASRSEYETKLSVRLRDRGFHEDDSPGAPLCRWVVGPIKVDVMPTAPEVFGFSNRWYAKAVRSAASVELPADGEGKVLLRVVSAPVFCATKLVAFRSRGGGNFDHSDLEDIVTVVDGRPELVRELEAEDDELRRFVGEEVRSLLAEGLEDALPGHLEGDASSQARLPLVRTALKRIARVPRVVQLDEVVRVAPGWEPGATGGPRAVRGAIACWRLNGLARERRVSRCWRSSQATARLPG